MSEEFFFYKGFGVVFLYVVTLPVVYAVGYYRLDRKYNFINYIFKNYFESLRKIVSDING